MEETILKIENLYKEYTLGTVNGMTLKEEIAQWRRKRKGDLKHRELSVHNKKYMALQDINVEIKKGEAIGIIGPNGAGKSTLLKIISRITAPTRGKVYIDGRVSSMLEVGTGFHQELTGRENIYLNGTILGMSRAEIDQKIESIIEFSECRKFIDTPVKRYSSGMYVKLAFSVAAHLDSEIVIMDEVLAVGDIQFQRKCLDKMKEIAESEKRTILYVSHNMDTIHKLCKRCLVLNQGQLIFDGDVDQAASIYIGENMRTELTCDYSKYLREGWLGRDDIRLMKASYLEKEDNIFYDQEKMQLCLEWVNHVDIHNLSIRIEISDYEKRPFATMTIYDVYTGKAGEMASKQLTIDLKEIMDGKYKTIYTLFYCDSYGQSVDLDCVTGLDFEIRKKNQEGLIWRSKPWGNIQLNSITIEEPSSVTR